MQKTMIVVYGRANEGKTSTLLELYKILTGKISDIDIVETFKYRGIDIGFASKSDPTQESLAEFKENLIDLAEKNCKIILCSSRTRGLSVEIVDSVIRDYEYHSIWISSLWSPTLNQKYLNNQLAKNLKELINNLINGENIYEKDKNNTI
jgi:hypothetical protein